MREEKDEAPVDTGGARHDPVAQDLRLRHSEVLRPVRLEAIVFAERARIHEQLYPLARGELALGVLAVDACLTPTEPGLLAELVEVLELILEGQR